MVEEFKSSVGCRALQLHYFVFYLKLFFFQLTDFQVIRTGSGELFLDLPFQGTMPLGKLCEMRSKRHLALLFRVQGVASVTRK